MVQAHCAHLYLDAFLKWVFDLMDRNSKYNLSLSNAELLGFHCSYSFLGK